MTELPPPPPPSPTRRGRFPGWLLGCCGGCLLLIVLMVVGTVFGIFAVKRIWEESTTNPEVQLQAYNAIVPNTGPPPGYRILAGNSISLAQISVVMFCPEATQGSFEQIMNPPPPTFAILWRQAEGDYDRDKRRRLFESGEVDRPPPFLAPFLGNTANELERVTSKLTTGTLPGHRFPIRYATIVGDARSSRSSNRMQTGRGSIAFLDLTPPNLEHQAIWALVTFMDGHEITVEELVRFSENFKPGE